MFVSGFTFVRNGLAFDYPFVESIRSALDLCDEFVVSVGPSDDGTRRAVESIGSPKIKIHDSVWDDTLREGGRVLAAETNKALDRVAKQADWALYLQADEVIHEKFLPAVRRAMEQHLDDARVEGLLFDYLHFYGAYRYVGDSRKWYRREVRAVRNDPAIRSWKDAQGFRKDGRKLRVRPAGACIYHYGWVKPPAVQQAKQQHFHKLWHDDAGAKRRAGEAAVFDYSRIDSLRAFTGTHPAVMRNRVAAEKEPPGLDPSRRNFSLKGRLLHALEKSTGWRPGEYRNYRLI
jgi:hypothetical protein